MVPDVLATPLEGTAAVSGSCNDTPVTAFVPELDYSLSFSAPAVNAGPACSVSLTITGNVNADTVPGINCSLTDQNAFVVMRSRTPHMKIGGLACTTHDRSILEAHGDGADTALLDVVLTAPGVTDWDGAKKVDDNTASSKAMLCGAGGQVKTTAILDGQDADDLTNGEVTFGTAVASQGASLVFTKVDYTDSDVLTSSHVETLTYTFTPQ